MEYIDLRRLSRGELKQISRQVIRLKKMGKTGKEICAHTSGKGIGKRYRTAVCRIIISELKARK